MKYPDIDKRSKKDIIQYIKKTSKAYTPEWRFDEENPDIGTALSFIFADMFSETIQRFNRVPEKNLTVFLNSTGAKLLPAIPASGYVTFGLVNQSVEGVEIRKGTQLIADTKDPQIQNLMFETVNDMYVTPAQIDHIYLADGEHDIITHIYERESPEKKPFHLFDLHGVNLQEHEFYFSHDDVLNIKGEAQIAIEWDAIRANDISYKFIEMIETGDVIFEYYGEQGFIPFASAKADGNKLILLKSRLQPGFSKTKIEEKESYWIRSTVKKIHSAKDIMLENIKLQSTGNNLLPDMVNANGVEQSIGDFFPFGERMYAFSECYIGSEEALSKKGARIQMNCTMDFIKVPLESMSDESSVNWKLIMKRSDFIPDSEYDITIEEVIWEYYNGEGWRRLFSENKYSQLFNAKNGTLGQLVSLDFICPEDMKPILINSKSTYYIRARVLKINNAFKLKGAYVTPLLSEVTFQYDYSMGGKVPFHMIMKNNLETEYLMGAYLENQKTSFVPFQAVEEKKAAIYLGFRIPPLYGPIKILFSMVETIDKKMPRLSYEYYAKGKWNALNVIDETDHMRTTGIVTMMGNKDLEPRRLWGQDLYWIRIVDLEDSYSNLKKGKNLPCISGIYMNTTNVLAVETMDPERFSISPKQENFSIKLLHSLISSIQVWVNEFAVLSFQDVSRLEREHEIRYTYDKNGDVSEMWIKWEEVEGFSQSSKTDRHYVIDKNEGIVIFSNGYTGAIPPSGEKETILVEYSCGGGMIGNLEPEQITRLNRSLGFVNSVYNSEITTGGCNQETTEEALRRNAAVLKHGYRAVTTNDYEMLAMEATRNILKAKCFSNCNELGQKEYGSVALVILQKDYEKGRKYFEQVKKQVLEYMQDKISGNLVELNKFYVVEPKFLELGVQVTITIKDLNMVFDVKEKVHKLLQQFIDPMTGNFNKRGWEIGRIPNSTQILNALKDIPEVLFVKNVVMTAYTNGDYGRTEVDLERVEDNHFAIALNGNHEIFIQID